MNQLRHIFSWSAKSIQSFLSFIYFKVTLKRFYLLWLASVLGAVAVLPYATTLASIELSTAVLLATLIQASIIYGVLIFFGIIFAENANFQITSSKQCIAPSIISGLVVGLVLKLLDHFILKHHVNILMNTLPHVDFSYRMLASFYGAINEEVLCRLFCVSLVALLLQKVTNLREKFVAVLSISFCALLFAVGHLPMLYKIVVNPNIYDIVRILFLNGFAGMIFGLLYWRYGLMAAMLSHFVADLVVHVFWIF
ncbi:MAG: CPBP family intramembrane metalloprotease [Gammaproteobacteria bacterium]|nr:CPBP family intramembrane metalloprotease [Gammaproteobacteria bacterium]